VVGRAGLPYFEPQTAASSFRGRAPAAVERVGMD
jgi:hypothetical protein